MKKLVLAIVSLSLALAVVPAMGYVYISSDSNGSPVGASPPGWTLAGLSGTIRQCTVVSAAAEWPDPPGPPAPADIIRCIKFHDANGDASNISCYRVFPATYSGTVTVTFDVMLAQTTGAFFVRMCNEGSITSAGSWANMLLFEGNVPWEAFWTTSPSVSYLRTRNSLNYVRTGATYDANTWYTVKMELYLDADPLNRKWSAWFGAKGDPFPLQIVDNVELVFDGATHAKVDNVQKIVFYTSTKSTGTNPEGDELVYLDNITVEGPVAPLDYATIGQARLADKATLLRVTDRIVTAGSNAFGQYFYMQDNHSGAPGIRVRTDQLVHEGDKVDVWGRIAQASESGSATTRNCEREIVANSVVVQSSGNMVPRPVVVLSKNMGGGWLGPTEIINAVSEPKLKGVYPYNNAGDVTTFDPLTCSLGPTHNVGTLVTVVGQVTKWCGDYPTAPLNYSSNDYYIWDTSNLAENSLLAAKYADYDGWHVVDSFQLPPQIIIDENSHPAGIRVRVLGGTFTQLPALNVGDTIAATGIASAMSNSEIVGSQKTRNIRVVRIRKAADVVLLNDVPPP